MKKITLLIAITCLQITLFAQKGGESIIKELEKNKEAYGVIAQQIWDYAEMGYLEEQSTALLQKTLSDEGFSIQSGVAGIPTAFVAEFGSGAPVVALLGEFDALPGLSQERVPEKKSAGKAAGHACGHHLFGTASAAAAISVKNWMKKNKIKGNIAVLWHARRGRRFRQGLYGPGRTVQ